jgi:hypothetical protein
VVYFRRRMVSSVLEWIHFAPRKPCEAGDKVFNKKPLLCVYPEDFGGQNGVLSISEPGGARASVAGLGVPVDGWGLAAYGVDETTLKSGWMLTGRQLCKCRLQ